MVLAQLVNAVGRKPEDHWFESSTSLFFFDLPDFILPDLIEFCLLAFLRKVHVNKEKFPVKIILKAANSRLSLHNWDQQSVTGLAQLD